MTRRVIRHLVFYDGRNGRQWYFKPSKLMRSGGYRNEPLGTDEAAAIKRVQELNAQWDKERSAAPPEPAYNTKAGTVEWLVERFRMDPTWYKARADRTREQIEWAFKQMTAVFGEIRVHDMPKGLRRSLFKAWLTLMRNNDVKATLDRCRGSAFWASAGRNACRVPLWLDGPGAVP